MRLRNVFPALVPVVQSEQSPSVSARDVLQALGMADDHAAAAVQQVNDSRSAPLLLAVQHPDGPERRLTVAPSGHDVRVAERAGVRRQSNSKFAAQLRRLLATFSSSPPTHGAAQSIVTSGVGAWRGYSLVASSLAVTCAANGFQVLLVDANLSRPSLHTLFGVSNRFGLSDLLEGSDPPNLFAQATSIPNLAIIPAGMGTSNYASLLSRQRVVHRLDAISSAFDYIIIDASALPPTLQARVALNADQVAIAVRRHKSSMRDLERHIRVLREEGIDKSSVLIIE